MTIYVSFHKSTRRDKKYMAKFYDESISIIKSVYFGQRGYSDFILSGGDEVKKKIH